MRGGAGDDVLEWNDGDGSDTATGGDGLDLTRVNGSVTQGDAFQVAPNGAGIRFQRTNLVPFTIDLDTERIEMNGLAGNDTIAARPGLKGRLSVRADGGSGNDRIETRNGAADAVDGGSGSDSAVVDRRDSVTEVESIDRPSKPKAKVRSAKLAVRDGRLVLTLGLTCPADAETSCVGVLRLTSHGEDLGSRRYRIAPGDSVKVKVQLSRKAKWLAKRGKLSVRAVAASKHDGAVSESARKLVVRVPKG
jgi:hypothetical protein